MTLTRRTPLRAKTQLCACGCGQDAGVYRKTGKRGQPRTYIHGHHARKPLEYLVDKATGCWIWQKALDKDGYGYAWGDGRSVRAHRLVYERHRDTIPDDKQIDHLCRNRACVNPDHMELVSNRENILRGVGFAAENARKTHCPRGHAYDEANTHVRRGKRHCRACARERWHERKAA